jgi:hypothetical protein
MKRILDRRMMMTINSTLDSDTAQLLARDFGAEVLIRSPAGRRPRRSADGRPCTATTTRSSPPARGTALSHRHRRLPRRQRRRHPRRGTGRTRRTRTRREPTAAPGWWPAP